MKIATQSPPSLRVARPDIPPSFEAVVLRCLEKDQNQALRERGRAGPRARNVRPQTRASLRREDRPRHSGFRAIRE